VYAGGFNQQSEVVLADKASESDIQSVRDGFTTFGVKLWTPTTEEWSEVSIRGVNYAIGCSNRGSRLPLGHPYSNGECLHNSLVAGT
jgi:hypothetical protein